MRVCERDTHIAMCMCVRERHASQCVCVRERDTHSTDFEHKNVAQFKAHFEIGKGRNVYVCERETHILLTLKVATCVCVRETHTFY